MKLKTTTILLFCIFLMCAVFSSIASSQENGEKKKTSVVITPVNSLNYTMRSETVEVPGLARLEYGDLVATGTALMYNNLTKNASMKGDPLIEAVYGEEIKIKAGAMMFEVKTKTMTASGSLMFEKTDSEGITTVNAEEMVFDTEHKTIRCDKGVTMDHQSFNKKAPAVEENDGGGIKLPPPEKMNVEAANIFYNFDSGAMRAGGPVTIMLTTQQLAPEKDSTDASKKKKEFDLSEITVKSTGVNYNTKNGALTAVGPVVATFEGGGFEAGRVEGQTTDGVLTFTGGVKGKAGGVRIRADRMVLNYMLQELEAFGKITIQHMDSKTLDAEHLWLSYGEGDEAFKIEQDVRVVIDTEEDDEKQEDEGTSEGETR